MKNMVMAGVMAISGLAMADAFVLNGDAAKGKDKFQAMCASCHGPEGKGDGAAAKALTPPPTNFADAANADRLTDEWVYKMIRDGGQANGKSPLMVSWKASLKDDEIRNVAAYVRGFVPKKAPAAPAAPAKAEKKPAGKKG